MNRETPVTELACAGCGASPPRIELRPYPFRCARADDGDDTDHVVARRLDTSRVSIDARGGANPFIRYRGILHSYHQARSHGVPDSEYCDMVERLSDEIARIDGRRFVGTPFFRSNALECRVRMGDEGAIWIKDETDNVSGSHKARHLMGVMLYLQIVERLGVARPGRPELVIASCGNAALAAASVARAAGWALRVFVPPTANRYVLGKIADLGARVEICERGHAGAGDPAYLRFRDAVRRGALPFCCQGSDNGLTIEGAETLVFEMIEAIGGPVDRLFVQVGGGALAAACVQGFAEARRMGLIDRLPRIHAVQTRGAFPLKRAYDRLIDGIAKDRASADWNSIVRERLRYARTHRSQFMWPWEEEPRSIAGGILDDESYDWAAVVEGMLNTGGHPVVVDENEIEVANAIARESTESDVDYTGTAGLAGLIHVRANDSSLRHERVAVIFSGARRPL